MKKLKIGTFNYPQVCEMMGWLKKSGNAKIAQMKQLEQYCKWHKEGSKIVIDEVYEKVGIFEGVSKVRRGKYNVEVGSSILVVVTSKLTSEEGVVYIKTKDLIVETTLANEKLFNGYIEDGYTKLEVISYKNVAKKMTYKAIESGLNWLNSSRTLKNNKVRMINIYDENKEENIIREANEKEDAMIFEGEQKILLDLGYENIFSVYIRNEFKEFGDKVIEYVYKNYGIKINYYYLAVKFTVTKFSKDRGIQLATKKADLNKEVWERTHKALVENAIKRKELMYEESIKVLSDFKDGKHITEGFSDEIERENFTSVIYAYPNYISNFKELDKKYRG